MKKTALLVLTTLGSIALVIIKFVWKTANNSVYDADGFKHDGKS